MTLTLPKRFLIRGFWTAALLIGIGERAAQACSDGASAAEQTFNATINCKLSDVQGMAIDYSALDSSWGPAGFNDACNPSLPFGKLMDAISLIGLAPHFQLGGFHDTIDYMNESRSTKSSYHGDFDLRFIQQGSTAAAEADSVTGRFLATDYTALHCLVFNNPGGTVTVANAGVVAERAAVLVHEAWHHWQEAHGFPTNHEQGPAANCTAGGAACDSYFFHSPDSVLPDGSLSSQIGNLAVIIKTESADPDYFHSPYQVMVEFTADIALLGNPDIIPIGVRREAVLVGNFHASSNFLNVVPFVIGTPQPFPPLVPRKP